MTHLLQIRNLVTLIWFVLGGCLTVIFGWFIATQWRRQDWYQNDGNRAAVALFFYLLGGTLVRLTFLVLPYNALPGGDPFAWTGLLTGGFLSIGGALCAIRVFAPKYGRCIMLACVALTGAVMIFHPLTP